MSSQPIQGSTWCLMGHMVARVLFKLLNGCEFKSQGCQKKNKTKKNIKSLISSVTGLYSASCMTHWEYLPNYNWCFYHLLRAELDTPLAVINKTNRQNSGLLLFNFFLKPFWQWCWRSIKFVFHSTDLTFKSLTLSL